MKIGYIGVDIFFFVSAYSIADKDIDYLSFLKNRFSKIYLKFLFFVIVEAVISGWTIAKIVKTALGINLFIAGGGSFLWFLPAIMIFYLVFPVYLKWDCKIKAGIVLVLWIIISFILSKYIGYSQIFIFTNRIPIILLASYLKKHDIHKSISIICLPVGIFLLYIWGFNSKLNVPIKDMYYIIAIPTVIGIAAISAYVKDNRLIKLISSASLEIYAVSMIFGPTFVMWMYKLVNNIAITNIVSMICLSVGVAIICEGIRLTYIFVVRNERK